MRFDVDTIIYIYMYLCLSLLVFNVWYTVWSRLEAKRNIRNQKRWTIEILKQIDRINSGKEVEENHKKSLEKQLQHVENLIVYSNSFDMFLLPKDKEQLSLYLNRVDDIFVKLACKYQKKGHLEKAFFAHFIEENHMLQKKDEILEILISFMEDSSVHCQESVMRILCKSGKTDFVKKAIRLIEICNLKISKPTLTKILDTFQGEPNEISKYV